jgi:dTMP kinase
MLITIEGGEGAGKSTVMTAIVDLLHARGLEVVQTREPGGTPAGETIRALLLDPLGKLEAETELLLMFAARAQLVRELIRPALARGAVVLSDRFTDASFAYQGGGRGIEMGRIAELERWAAGIKPDLTFLLDVGVEQGLQRARSRGGEPDRIEREHGDFFERVRAVYLARAAAEPTRFRVIDAAQPADKVVADVSRELQQVLDAKA